MIVDGINGTEGDILSFLMIGQSNMAGRGDLDEVEPIDNPQCRMLRMGRWQKMSEPINPDRAIFNAGFHSGISLAASFADEVQRHLGVRVGLIPCADGGTAIDQWMPGEILYDHALMMTRLAMRSSRLAGIIWHQGESDCHTEESALAHRAKFAAMITALRRDIGAEELPLVIGEISENISERWRLGERPGILNRAYRELARELPATAVASAEGLTLRCDGIHFDSRSCRLFGKRYFEAYRTLL